MKRCNGGRRVSRRSGGDPRAVAVRPIAGLQAESDPSGRRLEVAVRQSESHTPAFTRQRAPAS